MSQDVLYLGDTQLDRAASYLAGVLAYHDVPFDYLPSDVSPSDEMLDRDYSAIIISDYPSSNFSADQLARLADKVNAGMGLLMIGGWESYTGLGGDYHSTPLAEVLPVVMHGTDDRQNCFSPCMIEKCKPHPILDQLPFDDHATAVGGFNAFIAKPTATTLLNIQHHHAKCVADRSFQFTADQTYPLLVVDQFGSGHVASFASDVAPHWVGGFVDWGDARVESCASGATSIEVGNWYAQFFINLVRWTGQLSCSPRPENSLQKNTLTS